MLSERGGRSFLQNVSFSRLKIDLCFSLISKDVVDWCRSLQYGCMDAEQLEWDVITGGLGVYLLVNNDGGCSCEYISWFSSSLKPFS